MISSLTKGDGCRYIVIVSVGPQTCPRGGGCKHDSFPLHSFSTRCLVVVLMSELALESSAPDGSAVHDAASWDEGGRCSQRTQMKMGSELNHFRYA